MKVRKACEIRLQNTPANQGQANYLNRPFEVSTTGKTIKLKLSPNEFQFAESPAKLKEALGF